MPRQALVVELQPDDVGHLTFLAGVLVGLGMGDEAAALQNLVGNVLVVEVPDNFGQEEAEQTGVGISDPETGDIHVTLGAAGESNEAASLEDDEFEEIDVNTDPTAPENLNVRLELPAPDQPDFVPSGTEIGAGPPPQGMERGR